MKKIIESKYGLLIFSLLSGLAYFILIMQLISETKYSYLLGIFFFPTVICGAALCIIKSVRAFIENEEFDKAKKLLILHVFVIIFALIYGLVGLFAR